MGVHPKNGRDCLRANTHIVFGPGFGSLERTIGKGKQSTMAYFGLKHRNGSVRVAMNHVETGKSYHEEADCMGPPTSKAGRKGQLIVYARAVAW